MAAILSRGKGCFRIDERSTKAIIVLIEAWRTDSTRSKKMSVDRSQVDCMMRLTFYFVPEMTQATRDGLNSL
jgi:hypothetical protein